MGGDKHIAKVHTLKEDIEMPIFWGDPPFEIIIATT